ncbi:hypothetical protein OF83DRAFT_1111629 [Amylostereum chailletii]|nr:hypothetical protein OF83DRAFT_1111629 [Amylostereum chailletii]
MSRSVPDLSLMNALYVCIEEKRNDVVQHIVDKLWPHLGLYLMRQFTLTKRRRASWLARLELDGNAAVIRNNGYATVQSIARALGLPDETSTHRFGLMMSEPVYQEAKRLLASLNTSDISALCTSGLNPTFLVNAFIDLQMDLPDAFEDEFFWLHLQHLIDASCVRSLSLPGSNHPRLPSAALNEATDDPNRVLAFMRTIVQFHGMNPQAALVLLPPGSTVLPLELAGTRIGTGAQLDARTLSCLPKPPQLLLTSGDAWALLCAFLLWGRAWGTTATVQVLEVRAENLRLVHCVNDWTRMPLGSIERFVGQTCARRGIALRARWAPRERNPRARALAGGCGKRLAAFVDVAFELEATTAAEAYFRGRTPPERRRFVESVKIADSLEQWLAYRAVRAK